MRKILVVVLAALTITGLLLAACAPAAAPPAAPAPTAAPPAPTPKTAVAPAVEKPRYGGVFKMGGGEDAAFYDPHVTSAAAAWATSPFWNGVVWFDPTSPDELKILPDLAERWDVSADGTVYTFHLQKGVKWHDGAPLTAKDIVFSINSKLMKPPKLVPAPRAEPAMVAVKEAQALDDYTVKVTLKYPSGSFLENLAGPHVLMVPKDYMEKGGYQEGKMP